MMRWFFILLIFFLPFFARAADPLEILLKPKVTNVHRSNVCVTKSNCQTILLIQGKNFVNRNSKRVVKVGKETAQILRWTDTQIVAAISATNKSTTPLIVVDQSIHRPKLTSNDTVLVKMFEESVSVALASIKQRTDGSRYMVAGPKYADLDRVYYRDSFWTSGLLLFIEPAFVRDQLLLLARGIESNGSTPSAIPVDAQGRKVPLWINHYDSGSYFILMLSDYIRFTDDKSILKETVNKKTIYDASKQILIYLRSQDRDKNLLPEKPKDSVQDWLDTIPRSGEVISNVILYQEAVERMSELAKFMRDINASDAYANLAIDIRASINDQFWNPITGSYFESCFEGSCIDRLTNESSLAILFDVIEPENRDRFFNNLLQLDTRKNQNLIYKDWGVMNAYPFYENTTKPYVYHNGTDWPFLDAINAGARLKYRNTDWRYPLTRWWTYFNETRKTDERLPEYVSPIDQNGGLDQAWSVSPMASLLRYGFGIDPDVDGLYTIQPSLNGSMGISDIVVRGKIISAEIK